MMTDLIKSARELCEGAYKFLAKEGADGAVWNAIDKIPEMCDALEKAQVEIERLRKASDNKCDSCACELLNRAEKAEAERDKAVEDIHTAYSDGLCEVCGKRETCLMSLDRGEEGTVCRGLKFEYRSLEGGKNDAGN